MGFQSRWKLYEENCEKSSIPAVFINPFVWVIAAFENSFVTAVKKSSIL
jgi:hypothetical protein